MKKLCSVIGHVWLPYSGYQNPDSADSYAGQWGVERFYCIFCLKVKEDGCK